jgi:glycogen synthase
MLILMATPEAAPFARAGNLAEVIYGLSRALVGSGHRVGVVMPLYRQVLQSGGPGSCTGRTLSVSLSYKTLDAEIFHTRLEPGLDFYFIRQDSLFDRDGLYGTCYGDFQDNAEVSSSLTGRWWRLSRPWTWNSMSAIATIGRRDRCRFTAAPCIKNDPAGSGRR